MRRTRMIEICATANVPFAPSVAAQAFIHSTCLCKRQKLTLPLQIPAQASGCLTREIKDYISLTYSHRLRSTIQCEGRRNSTFLSFAAWTNPSSPSSKTIYAILCSFDRKSITSSNGKRSPQIRGETSLKHHASLTQAHPALQSYLVSARGACSSRNEADPPGRRNTSLSSDGLRHGRYPGSPHSPGPAGSNVHGRSGNGRFQHCGMFRVNGLR